MLPNHGHFLAPFEDLSAGMRAFAVGVATVSTFHNDEIEISLLNQNCAGF